MRKSIRLFLPIVLLLASPLTVLQAQGRKKADQKADQPSETLQDAKRNTNKALDTMSDDLHKAGKQFKKDANDSLQIIDDKIHNRK